MRTRAFEQLVKRVKREFIEARLEADARAGLATDGVARNVPLRAAKGSPTSGAATSHSADTTADRRAGARSSRD